MDDIQGVKSDYEIEEFQEKTKFCKHCGKKIPEDAVFCVLCGRQVELLQAQPNVVINNSNNSNSGNTGRSGYSGFIGSRTECLFEDRAKDKWVAMLLCFFVGIFGAHKFYEGDILIGVLYACTGGLCGVAVVVDFIVLLFKSNPYYY